MKLLIPVKRSLVIGNEDISKTILDSVHIPLADFNVPGLDDPLTASMVESIIFKFNINNRCETFDSQGWLLIDNIQFTNLDW